MSIRLVFNSIWQIGGILGEENRFWIMTLFPALGGLIVGLCISSFAKSASGSGIPQTKVKFYNDFGVFKLRDVIYRFVLGTIFCGFGNSAGREGPTVHLSSAAASVMAQKAGFSKSGVRAAVPVGMAAGISASFNAPLSAMAFVYEELLGGFSSKHTGGLMLAVVIAAALSRIILGENPIIPISHTDFHTGWWMFICIPIAIVAGFAGNFFLTKLLFLRSKTATFKMPKALLPALGGLIVGAIASFGYYQTGYNSVFSVGYHVLLPAFDGNLTLYAMLVLFALKFAASLINYAFGGSGGLFSPTLVIGGMLGGAFGAAAGSLFNLDSSIVGASLMLGMGACFASIIRCPITSIIMIFELTLNYSLILPLLVGNLLSYYIASKLHPLGLYDSLILQDKITLKKMSSYRGQRDWSNLPISAIMSFDVVTVGACERVGEALARLNLAQSHHRAYPVLDESSNYVGVLKFVDLQKKENANLLCAELITTPSEIKITPDTSIKDAANYLINKDVLECVVVSATQTQKIAGIITLHDIARQQNASEEDSDL